jgi:myo-inositol-1(or 4)-monophosphatase
MKETLISALKTSGKVLLEFFNKQIISKEKESQSSIVTEADFKSDSVITQLIRDSFPAHNILSEESGFVNHQSEFTWIVDPLDGTSNFVAGIPWFGVLITLFRNEEPFMAGAYLPVQKLLYFAEKGKGAFRNDELLPPVPDRKLHNSLIAFCVDYTEDEYELDKEIAIFRRLVQNVRNIRATNSLVDFLYVAEGRFGGVINVNTKVWDISGLGLIISEAGGIMRKTDGSEIGFSICSELSGQNFPVMAGSAPVLEELKRMFARNPTFQNPARAE